MLNVCRLLSVLYLLFSITFLFCASISWFVGDVLWIVFLKSFACVFIFGGLLLLLTFRRDKALSLHEGFVLVVGTWTTLSFMASLPFIFFGLPILDSIFEGVSGLTTTGAEVFTGLDAWPTTLLFYHQFLEWLGGLGIIILAISIMPLLGVGGMQLYRLEISGPMQDKRLAPRIVRSAEVMWLIYVGLTVLCFLAYYFSGLSAFEALGESLSTVSTGGFSLHDQSIAYYHNAKMESFATVFMILGATKFGLHYVTLQMRSLDSYFKDIEWVTMIRIIFYVWLMMVTLLLFWNVYADIWVIFGKAGFTVVSMLTTTGFRNVDFSMWPSVLPIVIMLLPFMGGCAGSTTGGIKMMRFMLLQQDAHRALWQLSHPNAVLSIKFGEQQVSETIIQSMRGFIALFIMLFIVLFLLVMATGISFEDSFAAMVGCLTNVGASIASLRNHYGILPDTTKMLLIFAMLAGRLEIMTLMVLFLPSFWKRF
jgi:trk system potassium uptake protein